MKQTVIRIALIVPFVKERWKAATILASILSLLLFAVAWTGLLPHPSDAVFGPVISGALLVGLLIDLLVERTVLQPRPRLHRGAHSLSPRNLPGASPSIVIGL